MRNCVIGIDFGTDSVRALLVEAATGKELKSTVIAYPRWAKGLYCNPAESSYRQHPLDYIESMDLAVQQLVAGLTEQEKAAIAGIGIDTTGSTPVATDAAGTPLALIPAFAEDPDAMFILWKDHTSHHEAEQINLYAKQYGVDYTRFSGGRYSPEWFWAKIFHVLRKEGAVAEAAVSWLEHCDWIPALLTGNKDIRTIRRSRCAAGHKAMWHESFGGLPPEDFWASLHPCMAGLRANLYEDTFTADQSAGGLSVEWAAKWGLQPDTPIAVGAIDAHFGAVGAAVEPYTLVKVIGTSTCDMLVATDPVFSEKEVQGICGQVDGSIVPGMIGMEAGQSAFGDFYSWFKKILCFSLDQIPAGDLPEAIRKKAEDGLLAQLSAEASRLPASSDAPIALDWINGRRTPDCALNLTAVIAGIHLGTSPAELFRALVEATAFGSKAIVERFQEEGIAVNKVIALGGISKKSPFVMQTLANVLGLPIEVVKSEQACALGAAMFAATAAGLFPGLHEAQQAMHSGIDAVYFPQQPEQQIAEERYRKYKTLGVCWEEMNTLPTKPPAIEQSIP